MSCWCEDYQGTLYALPRDTDETPEMHRAMCWARQTLNLRARLKLVGAL